MKVDVNMLTFATGRDAEKSVEVTKHEFWGIYLDALGIKNGVILSHKTKEFFVQILSEEKGKNFFSGDNRKYLKEKLNLHNTQFTHFSEELIKCRYMERKGRGKVLPTQSFYKVQQALDQGIDMNLLFPMRIKNDRTG